MVDRCLFLAFLAIARKKPKAQICSLHNTQLAKYFTHVIFFMALLHDSNVKEPGDTRLLLMHRLLRCPLYAAASRCRFSSMANHTIDTGIANKGTRTLHGH